MQKIIFINSRNNSLEISGKGPFVLQKLEGTGCAGSDIQTSKSPYQDGIDVLDVILKERTISIKGTILGEDMTDLFSKRQLLSRIFNPKLKKASLKYVNDFGEKCIECYSEDAPVFGENYATLQEFLITLLCPSPFWLDENFTKEEIITWVGGASFPISFPVKFANKGETKKNIINIGDVETPVEITFKGPAINPCVTNLLTGEYIKVKRSLSSDDILIINTEFGNKKVEIQDKNGVRINAFNWIDLNSTFFNLQVGDNTIQYTSDGADPASVVIKYYNRYVGL